VYKACMDEERIESAGLEPLLIKLRELGGWPVLEGDAWNQTGKEYITNRWQSNHPYGHRLNTALVLRSLFGLLCAAVLIG
jgi:hypothetical protein